MRLHTQGHARLRTGIAPMIVGKRQSRHLIPLVALTLVLSALCVPSVVAQTTTAETAAVRVVHASVDTPPVDVYLDGEKIVSAISFTQAQGYLSVYAGSHMVQVFGQGVNPRTAVPVVAVPGLAIPTGARFSLVIEGVFANMRLTVVDDTTFAPAPGKAKLRFVHAAPDVSAVNVAINNGLVLFANTQFGTATPYQDVDAARYDLRIFPTDSGNTTAVVTSILPEAGKAYSMYLMSLGTIQYYFDAGTPLTVAANSVPTDMGMPAVPVTPFASATRGAPTMTPATVTTPARTLTTAAAPTLSPQMSATAATVMSRPVMAPVATVGAPGSADGGTTVMLPVTGAPLGETVSTEMQLLTFAALVLIAGGITMKRYHAHRWNTTIYH